MVTYSTNFFSSFKKSKRVQKDLIVPPNVVAKASKSGKSSGEKYHAFLNEVLRPLVGKKFLLFLDSWVHINQKEMTISDRQYFINVHCVIHNQLSAPQFKNLIKNGFIQAGITYETIGHIENLNDVCFKFSDLYCSIKNCNEPTLLMCAWCKKALCYYHLVEDLHLHL